MTDKRLVEIINTKQFGSILYECETYEVEALAGQKQSASTLFYGSFLLGYLINDDLNNCRFLWKRMPNDAKKDDDLKGIWEVAKQLWNRNYEGAYQAISQLSPASPQLKELINFFVDQLRQRTLLLISKAYANINATDLMKSLGISDVNVLNQIVSPLNWTFDSTKNVYIPQVITVKPPEMPVGLDAIKGMTQKAVFLELD